MLEDAYRTTGLSLNPKLDKRIPFFLYASINDMQQSNIADTGDGVGGVTEAFKDRFMVWSDGSREWLEDVIRHEFAHEVQFSLLIDGFWKSARILKLYIYPLWMMEGIAEYATGDRDLAVEEMYIRDAAADGRLTELWRLNQFSHLKPHQVTYAYKLGGQAVRFLAEQYGEDRVGRMLELYRTRYDASSVLLPLVGADIFGFDSRFRERTTQKFLAQAEREGLRGPEAWAPPRTANKYPGIPEFNLSPARAAGTLAWLSTEEGHPPVVKALRPGDKKARVLRGLSAGAENIPYGRFTKPLRSLSLSPDGRWAVFSGQRNHREGIYAWDLETGRSARLGPEGLEETRQPHFSPDGKRLVFVGMKGGFNDLYEMDFHGLEKVRAARRLTEDRDDESSPTFAPDGAIYFSCELPVSSAPVRGLCSLAPGGEKKVELTLDGSVYDPAVSPDGSRVIFTCDRENIFDLYEYEPASGAVTRLTRSLGGSFTPSYGEGGEIVFAAFRGGEMNVHSGPRENFLSEVVVPPADGTGTPCAMVSLPDAFGVYRPYRFRASTDLFFPAFLFSSPGGLFWMNYWQASDMLGDHKAGLFLTYNSGAPYLSYQFDYTYGPHRTRFYFSAAGLSSEGNKDALSLEYDKRWSRQIAGASYPFDRYNGALLYLIRKNEKTEYTDVDYAYRNDVRAAQLAYFRDTANGVYLLANRGSRLQLSWIKAVEKFGGNRRYDAYVGELTKFFPLSKQATLVNRLFAAESFGRDRDAFDYGGLSGVRGYARRNGANEAGRVLVNNLEWRFPLFEDLNYYMWYMFPDFYFKTIFAKVFVDSAVPLQPQGSWRFSADDAITSVGFGVNVHTFILQAFPLVLSLDYARRLDDGGYIVYFYLGPLF
ncbi:MAG: surface antigen (D15) [Elusimicrobia bacterium]|nr:MAG: surface antigen (D15) [Elusimicrobiota bacterium]KAF0156469.1 MAG: surface antigen (D15) [Elusimicrobiota bacterium]